MTTIGYCRLSTAEQASGTTLEQQIQRVRAAGASEVLVDLMSGTSTARPKYRQLLRRIEEGTVSKVICVRWDRLTRGATETCRLVDVFTADGAPELLLLDDPMDLSSIGGRLQLRLLGAVAQAEVERLRERSAAGKAFRKAQGKSDTAPFGMRLLDGKLEPDRREFICSLDDRRIRSRADLVLEAFDLLEQKQTSYAPWTHLGEVHGVWLNRTGISRLLHNPALRGARVGRRDKNRSSWASVEEGLGGTPLIDPERHRRVIATLEAKGAQRNKPDRRRKHVLGGKVVCGHCAERKRRLMDRSIHSKYSPRYRCNSPECSYRIKGQRQNSMLEHKLFPEIFKAIADQADRIAIREEESARRLQEGAKDDAQIRALQDKRQMYLRLLADGDPVQSVIDGLDSQIAALLSASDTDSDGITPLKTLRAVAGAYIKGSGPTTTRTVAKAIRQAFTDRGRYALVRGFSEKPLRGSVDSGAGSRWQADQNHHNASPAP